MFVVVLEDGQTLVEGTDVNNWQEISSDKKILSVTLTSGFGITRTLSGCDSYVVTYRGIKKSRQSVNAKFMVQYPQEDYCQICYGKRNISRHLRFIQDEANRLKYIIKQKIRETDDENFKNILLGSLQHVITREKSMIIELRNKEYEFISININSGKMSSSQVDINEQEYKTGIVDDSSVPNQKEISKKLLE